MHEAMTKIEDKFEFTITINYFFEAGSRHLLDTQDDINNAINDAEKELQGFVDKFYGGVCVKDDMCLEPVAFCDKAAGATAALGTLAVDGQCRPVFWVWIILAVLVLLLVGACVCCICCGICSCLYKCLCCCCRDKGYTPANTHG